MALVVQKYGGTSVGDVDRIRAVARRVADRRRSGDSVVVIVSAMGHTTDELLAMARQVSDSPHPRALDMLLTAGERISMALLEMAIRDQGIEALSLTGSQAGILTDMSHGQARIKDIRPFRVEEGLADGKVMIVAGFQGVNPDTKEITTLGRGGSDATAVAFAAALGADECEILTDVAGVFTADPRLIPEARKLDEISYEEMLELAASGAQVLMGRSVEFGMRYSVPIHVRSSFDDGEGTWVKEMTMEQALVSGVAHDTTLSKVTLRAVPDKPGVAAILFGALAAAGVSVDTILQNQSSAGVADISFTVPRGEMATVRPVLDGVAAEISPTGVEVDDRVAKVSIVGAGMRSHPQVVADMFRILGDAGINIDMITTSSIRVSCLIDEDDAPKAVRLLHDAFQPPTMADAS
jgi:aspartate kinase